MTFFRIGEMAASQASVLIHYLGDETIAVNFLMETVSSSISS